MVGSRVPEIGTGVVRGTRASGRSAITGWGDAGRLVWGGGHRLGKRGGEKKGSFVTVRYQEGFERAEKGSKIFVPLFTKGGRALGENTGGGGG